jgi:hypothetical protein
MRFKDCLGFNPATAALDTLGEEVFMSFKAGGAISVGTVVSFDRTDTTGKTVITATTAATTRLLCAGAFEGVTNGQGTKTTVTGLTGRAAVSGDVVEIKVFGKAALITGPQTSNDLSTSGLALTMGNTAGQLQANTAATVTGWLSWPIFNLEIGPTTAAATGVTACFVRFI